MTATDPELQMKKYCVCTLDILGYSNIVTGDDSELFLNRLNNALKRAITTIEKDLPNAMPLRHRMFSDNVLLYGENFGEGDYTYDAMIVNALAMTAGYFQRSMIVDCHVLIRGGIMIDNAYICDDFVYGPAICHVKELEEYTNYPFVKIDEGVIDYFEKSNDAKLISQTKLLLALMTYSPEWMNINYLSSRLIVKNSKSEYSDEILFEQHKETILRYCNRIERDEKRENSEGIEKEKMNRSDKEINKLRIVSQYHNKMCDTLGIPPSLKIDFPERK